MVPCNVRKDQEGARPATFSTKSLTAVGCPQLRMEFGKRKLARSLRQRRRRPPSSVRAAIESAWPRWGQMRQSVLKSNRVNKILVAQPGGYGIAGTSSCPAASRCPKPYGLHPAISMKRQRNSPATASTKSFMLRQRGITSDPLDSVRPYSRFSCVSLRLQSGNRYEQIRP